MPKIQILLLFHLNEFWTKCGVLEQCVSAIEKQLKEMFYINFNAKIVQIQIGKLWCVFSQQGLTVQNVPASKCIFSANFRHFRRRAFQAHVCSKRNFVWKGRGEKAFNALMFYYSSW